MLGELLVPTASPQPRRTPHARWPLPQRGVACLHSAQSPARTHQPCPAPNPAHAPGLSLRPNSPAETCRRLVACCTRAAPPYPCPCVRRDACAPLSTGSEGEVDVTMAVDHGLSRRESRAVTASMATSPTCRACTIGRSSCDSLSSGPRPTPNPGAVAAVAAVPTLTMLACAVHP